MTLKREESWIPYLFLTPAMIGLIVFRMFPIFTAGYSSFRTSMIGGGSHWAGLANYLFLFEDVTFWKSVGVTLIWSVIVNPFQIIIALALALLVNRQIKGIVFFRTVYFIPITVSLTIASTIWGLMLNPNAGLINSILAAVRLPPQLFLLSSKQALLSIVIIASWRGIGYWMMFFLAGLQEIPMELYEAARIDGANKGQILKNITFPLLKKIISFVVVADTCSNFLVFVPMFVLTHGGPNLSTNVLMYEAYKNAFSYGDSGLSSAIVMIILLMILVVVGVEMRVFRTDD
jgi:multiple sugar transport system permease protein